MGIFGAMQTAVSGLRAQSYALENISGNIANSQTTGFKRVDTSFVDLVPDLPIGREVAGSVGANARLTNTVQGSLQSTSIPTNVALNGNGYFIVQEPVGQANNQPVFNNTDYYTRRGDFIRDKDGYLVNGAGYFMKGSSIDPVTGEVTGAGNGVIRISNVPLPAKRTAQIEYRANLPSIPATTKSQPNVPQSELLNVANFTVDPTTTGSNTVIADDQQVFLNESISAGSITLYNDVGAAVNLQMRLAKTASTAYGSPDETWNLFYLENSSATGTGVAWRNVGTPITFATNGQMTSTPIISLANISVNNTTIGGAVNLNFGSSGLTQYASSSGVAQASTLRQDGYSSGELSSISVTSDGRISGNYTNGRVVPVAAIAVAQFNSDNSLKRRDGGAYEQTLESGLPTIGLAGSSISAGTLEGSNTDIADEFSKMIVTQQAYTANTRVVSTAQQMLTDVINIIR